MAIGAVLAGVQVGQSLFSSLSAKRKEDKRRKQRMSFFNNELSPLLEESTQQNNVDYGSLRQAELRMPTMQFQNQMRDITRSTDALKGKSGFVDSGFITDNFNQSRDMLNEGLDNQAFNIDRGLIDMQSQLESIVNQNKIRAKEIEYEYKYG